MRSSTSDGHFVNVHTRVWINFHEWNRGDISAGEIRFRSLLVYCEWRKSYEIVVIVKSLTWIHTVAKSTIQCSLWCLENVRVKCKILIIQYLCNVIVYMLVSIQISLFIQCISFFNKCKIRICSFLFIAKNQNKYEALEITSN